MDKLINELSERTGIDRATAQKVAGYLQANASRIPEMLGIGGGDGAKGKGGGAQHATDKVGDVMGRRQS
jgi:hypothetical protein